MRSLWCVALWKGSLVPLHILPAAFGVRSPISLPKLPAPFLLLEPFIDFFQCEVTTLKFSSFVSLLMGCCGTSTTLWKENCHKIIGEEIKENSRVLHAYWQIAHVHFRSRTLAPALLPHCLAPALPGSRSNRMQCVCLPFHVLVLGSSGIQLTS